MKKTRLSDNQSRKIRKIDILGISIIGLVLAILWVTVISYLANRYFFGHQNYYGQPVGTFLLLVFLLIVTPVYIIMSVQTIKQRRVNLRSTRK